MAKLSVGEIAPAPGERFPQLCLTIDGKRYQVSASAASLFGRQLAEAARWTVARVDVDVLRPLIAEIEIDPL